MVFDFRKIVRDDGLRLIEVDFRMNFYEEMRLNSYLIISFYPMSFAEHPIVVESTIP